MGGLFGGSGGGSSSPPPAPAPAPAPAPEPTPEKKKPRSGAPQKSVLAGESVGNTTTKKTLLGS